MFLFVVFSVVYFCLVPSCFVVLCICTCRFSFHPCLSLTLFVSLSLSLSLSCTQRLSMWESRERRKAKDHDKGYEKEELKKEEMVSTSCHVIIILSSVLNHAFPPVFRSERGGI